MKGVAAIPTSIDPRLLLGPGIPLASPTPGRTTGQCGQTRPGDFEKVFQQALHGNPVGGLNVSLHAEKRLQDRRIPFGPEMQNLLSDTLDELRAKGARDSLVITKEGAFVVNVPTRTLVTAMDVAEMQDRIVTKIDSVSVKNV